MIFFSLPFYMMNIYKIKMSVSSLTTTTTTKTNKNEIGSIQNIEKKKEAIK